MTRHRWVGVQIDPAAIPKDETAHFDSFAAGFDSRDAQEDIPDGSSPEMRDVEVSPEDRLMKAPGVTAIGSDVDHQPRQMFLHAGSTFSSELLLVSAPYLGVYKGGTVNWQSSSDFEAGTYSFANYAGIALFSKGPGKLLFREPKGNIGVVDGAPGGFAVGVFANRVLVAGTATDDEDIDLMRVAWNDSSGDYRSWKIEDGAGDQVLIGSSRARADRVQSIAYLGFNTVVMVCRRSIWIGQPTGDVYQPINFEPRLEDTGCSYAETVISTEYGVVFLSDDGVRLFTGNEAPVVSDQINQQLLPTLDSDGRYSASFDPARKRYYLHTPTGTWILDMRKRRWFRWCTAFRYSAFFPTQGADTTKTWGTALGSWGFQTGAWWQLGAIEAGSGLMHFVRERKLGYEDPTNQQAFGTDLIPRWRSPRRVQDNQDRLITHLGVRLTYESIAPAQIEIQMPAMGSGDFEPVQTFDLSFGVSLRGTRRAFLPFVHSGRGLGLGIRVVTGDPRIRKASLTYQDNGEQIGPVADIVLDDCPLLPPDEPADIIPGPPPPEEYVLHTFSAGTSDFNVSALGDGAIRVLMLAGGGSGGSVDGTGVAAGGGGAGGMIDTTQILVATGAHAVIVGTGGPRQFADHTIGVGSVSGVKGNNTTFNGLVALAGGAGHSHDAQSTTICNGGSGGGVESSTEGNGLGAIAGPFAGGTGVAGQGHNGGQSISDPTGTALTRYGGAGGGAGTAGGNYTTGIGGNGLQSDITGVNTYYGGGGGAGYMGSAPTGGVGGLGGGGTGGLQGGTPGGLQGTDGLGGGGGGGSATLFNPGGKGGDGICIVRYRSASGIIATGGIISTIVA